MTLYPSYSKHSCWKEHPLLKLHLRIIPFNEFGQLPYSTQQPSSSETLDGGRPKFYCLNFLLPTYTNPPLTKEANSLWDI